MGKTRTNILIDDEIKKMFESTKGIHNLTLGDATDIGMRYILTRINQLSMVSSEKDRKTAEASFLLREIDELSILEQKLKDLPAIPTTLQENKSNGNSENVEKRREAVLSKIISPRKISNRIKGEITIMPDISKIIRDWDSGESLVKWDWNTLVEKCGFKNKDEAVSWFEKKIRELAAKQDTLSSS